MKYLAAYALLVLGGKANPTADDVKGLLKSVDAQIDETSLKTVLVSLNGKPLHELIANGVKKVGASASVPAAKGAAEPKAAEKKDAGKKEEKKEAKKEVKK